MEFLYLLGLEKREEQNRDIVLYYCFGPLESKGKIKTEGGKEKNRARQLHCWIKERMERERREGSGVVIAECF